MIGTFIYTKGFIYGILTIVYSVNANVNRAMGASLDGFKLLSINGDSSVVASPDIYLALRLEVLDGPVIGVESGQSVGGECWAPYSPGQMVAARLWLF